MRPTMSQKVSKLSPDKLLDHLIDVISESVEDDPKALREALKEEGFDYDKIVADGLEFIHTLERKQKFAHAQEKQNKLMKLLEDVRSNVFQGTKDELIDMFKGLFAGEAAAAYFHKLQSVEEEDLREIIKEAEILKLFAEEIAQQDNSE